jgi:murein DD-endopeptidase MepM/ murein hydrolase activator NlpD
MICSPRPPQLGSVLRYTRGGRRVLDDETRPGARWGRVLRRAKKSRGSRGGLGLKKNLSRSASGIGRAGLFFWLVFLIAIAVLASKVNSRAAPTLSLRRPLKGIGQTTQLTIEASDPKHNVNSVQLEVIQDGQILYRVGNKWTSRAGWRWKFWEEGPANVRVWTVPLGRKVIPDLKEGQATIHIIATNDSWGRFFRGGRTEFWLTVPVRFSPPRAEVLTSQHYINQGGCELVVLRVSPGTVESGVVAGKYFFPSWPVKDSAPDTRLCLFAVPYNLSPKTPLRILARDDAGNESVTGFTYKIFPKTFHSDTIRVTDDFMARVVPAILSQTPDLPDQGDLLKNFLEVNGRLRENETQLLVSFSRKTAPGFLWREPFVELPSKVEASFADYRTYVYNGRVIDHQVHLGFDLAGVERMPVVAANDGSVVHAGFFGIYGNTIILDHGCGLQTLYGHLSSIEVKAGDTVKRGQVIAHSGQTGLAGGDHLHFTVLLDGIPVNPMEWWDPHWIHDRIQAKLEPYQ